MADKKISELGAGGAAQAADQIPVNRGGANFSLSVGAISVLQTQYQFSNSNRISFGTNVSTVTAQHALNFSGGTTSNDISDQLIFSNSNGVSFGLNGSTLTAAVQTVMAFADPNTSLTVTKFGFLNVNGLTLTMSTQVGGASLRGSYTVPGATVFSNSNNVSFGLNGSTITGTVTVASTQGSINLSAGTTSNIASLFVFSNSNNVSFGLNGSTLTGTVTVASTQGSINLSAGTTSNLGSNFVLSNSNNISFGLSGSTVTATASVATSLTAVNLSAGSTSNNLSNFVFSNSNNVSFGLNGSTVTASAGGLASYWLNAAAEFLAQTQTTSFNQSTSYLQPLKLDLDISISYIRFLHSFAATNTTSIATSVNATGSCSMLQTHFAVVYAQNTGASSLSLKSVASGSVGMTQMWSLSANANGSQWTLSQSITHPITGTVSQFTTGVTTSLTNYSLGSLSLTVFTGLQFLDIPFATSLQASNYWIMYGMSSTTSIGGSGANFSQLRISNSMIVASQISNPVALLGQTTHATVQLNLGMGSFSTNAIGTTASLGFSNISSLGSPFLMPVQLIRLT